MTFLKILILAVCCWFASAGHAKKAANPQVEEYFDPLSNDRSHVGPTLIEGFIYLKPNAQAAPEDLVLKAAGVKQNLTSVEVMDMDGVRKLSPKLYINLLTLEPEESDLLNTGRPVAAALRKKLALERDKNTQLIHTMYDKRLKSYLNGQSRFNVGVTNKSGNVELYNLVVSRTPHNFLIRKAFIKKLGYTLPEMEVVKRIKVTYKSSVDKESDLIEWGVQDGGDIKRFYEDSGEDSIIIHEALVMRNEAKPLLYDLSNGFLPPDAIQNRRALNSLVVAYSMVELPESINDYKWVENPIYGNQYRPSIDEDLMKYFSPSFEDCQWMVRKIAALTEEDFKHIMIDAQLPKPVGYIFYNKMLSRRNSLLSIFGLGSAYGKLNHLAPHEMNLVYEWGTVPKEVIDNERVNRVVKNGVLKQEYFPGYVTRFANSDLPDPMNRKEKIAFAVSRLISEAMGLANSAINAYTTPINSNKLATQKVIGEYEKFAKSLEDGGAIYEPKPTVVVPALDINVAFSRELVTGFYQGVDNSVMLADSIGMSMNVGAIFQAVSKIPLGVGVLQANVGVNGSVNFIHLKPIITIDTMKTKKDNRTFREALKEPWRNLLVPLLKKDLASLINPLKEEEVVHMSMLEKKTLYENTMNIFKEHLKIGESFIIQFTAGATGGVSVGRSLLKAGDKTVLSATAALSAGGTMNFRVHIRRMAEDVIHIYRGDIKSLSAMAGAGLVVGGVSPVRFNAQLSRGRAQVDYFNIQMEVPKDENGHVIHKELDHQIELMLGVRDVIAKNRFERLEKIKEPYHGIYNFGERKFDLKIGAYRFLRYDNNMRATWESPSGEKIVLYKAEKNRSNGLDVQTLFTDAVTATVGVLSKANVKIGGEAPIAANTLGGRARIKLLTAEARLVPLAGKKWKAKIESPFIKITLARQGWNIKRHGINKIIEEFNQRFAYKPDQKFFTEQTKFLDLKSLLFFNIVGYVNVYEGGVYHLLHAPDDLIESVTGNYSLAQRLKINLRLSRGYLGRNNARMGLYHMRRAVELAFNQLDIKHFVRLLGGEKNVFGQGILSGYGRGEENSAETIYSNSIGEFGSIYKDGPWSAHAKYIEISEAEFRLGYAIGRLSN